MKILDFGLAGTDNSQLTTEHTLLGTPEYMAPEQAAGAAVDGQSDLFSLGCVLYLLTTGISPFRRDNVMATLTALALHVPKPPRELNPGVPASLSELIMHLLSRQPADRPASARAVVDELRAIEQAPSAETTIPQQPVAGRSTRRLAAWSLAAGLAVLALLGGIIIKIRNRDGSTIVVETDKPATIEIPPDATAPDRKHDGPREPPSAPAAKKPPEEKPSPSAAEKPQERQMAPPYQTGKWWLDGDSLVTEGIRDGHQFFLFGDPTWRDYALKVEVRVDEIDGPNPLEHSIVFLADEQGTQYWKLDLGAFFSSKNFDLVPIVVGEDPWRNPARKYSANRLHGKAGVWYAVEVRVHRAQVTVLVDGETIAMTEHPKLSQGRVGVKSFNLGLCRRKLEPEKQSRPRCTMSSNICS